MKLNYFVLLLFIGVRFTIDLICFYFRLVMYLFRFFIFLVIQSTYLCILFIGFLILYLDLLFVIRDLCFCLFIISFYAKIIQLKFQLINFIEYYLDLVPIIFYEFIKICFHICWVIIWYLYYLFWFLFICCFHFYFLNLKYLFLNQILFSSIILVCRLNQQIFVNFNFTIILNLMNS